MRPSSSPSKRAVLSLNSTRPSHRRRRRLRFELQLERLEERSLLSTGLVAAYNFDAGSGAVLADVSGNGNNGTITGATWTTSGKYGGALVFNGTNALVTIPDSTSLNLTTGMTLEAWVNPSTVTSAWRDLIYKGNDNYWLEATSENSVVPAAGATLGSSDVDTLGTAALTANTWTFLTETYNGSALDLYVNGTLVSSLAHTGNIATSTDPLQIGGDSIYGQYFKGMIDNVRIYNTALTQAQIQTDMTTAVTSAAPVVTGETPASGATGVATNTEVTATFNQAVQASSITTTTFTLKNSSGTAVAATVAYNSSTDTATLTPSAALAYGTTYTATVSGAKNTAGDPMARSATWSFTTATSNSSTLTVSAGSNSSASPGQQSHRSWIQLAAIAYQPDNSETAAQVAWNAANIDWFDNPHAMYQPTYAAAGDQTWIYDNYYCMYVGGGKYNAMVAWCTAHSVPLESMFVHLSVSTVVNLGTTYTLPVGSRVPAYVWGPSGSDLTASGAMVVNNVGNPSFQAFNAAWEAETVGQFTGIYVDSSTSHLLSDLGGVQSGGTLQEYPNASSFAGACTAYYSDYEKMFPPVHNAGIKQVINICNYQSDRTLYPYINGLFREDVLDLSNETDSGFSSLLSDMQSAQAAGVPNIVCTINTTSAQNQMSALAAYYIAANITDYFCKSDSYSGDVQTNDFFGALNVNIGQPIGAAYVFATGTDPSGFAFKVWARQYTGGFAIFKPSPAWNDLTTGPATASTYTLPAAYKPLNADGSLGTATNQVTLQNGMGAVFIQ